MFIEKGFTLIETLVVASILVLSILIWLFVFRSTTSTNKDLSVDQEYYYLYSLLLSRVKIDLRSATEWKKVDDNTYTIKSFADPKDGVPVERTVTYKVTDKGRKVERNDGKKTSVFDFSTMQGGGTFEFRILP